MARTVVAIYDDFHTANDAVRELIDAGFPRDNISIIANNQRGEYGYSGASTANESVADDTGAGAGVGAGIGAALGGIGGLLIGLGALTIPGIGPVIAAGPLAVALSTLTGAGVGAVAGGVTGGLLGALIGLGIPEDEAEYYAEGVRRGGVLVTVQAEDFNTDQIMGILNRHNPMDIHSRAAQWREEGWTGYDPNTQATASGEVTMPTHPVDRGPVMDPDRTQPAGSNPSGMFRADDSDMDTVVDDTDYRSHYNTYLADRGFPYDYYRDAYTYGHGLASDARYQNSTWAVVEPDARRNWELNHPGTWERFQEAIRYSWENVTGQRNRRG